MGQGAAHGRRALVDIAREAVARANACTADVAEAQKNHNALVEQVGKDIADLKRRADAHAAWLKENERRTIDVRKSLLTAEQRFDVFRRMSFWQRLLWLARSVFPDVEAPAALSTAPADKPTVLVVDTPPIPTRFPVGMSQQIHP